MDLGEAPLLFCQTERLHILISRSLGEADRHRMGRRQQSGLNAKSCLPGYFLDSLVILFNLENLCVCSALGCARQLVSVYLG